jgi:hypothetical protein
MKSPRPSFTPPVKMNSTTQLNLISFFISMLELDNGFMKKLHHVAHVDSKRHGGSCD